MEHSANHFDTPEELAENLARNAVDIEERAWMVMENAKDSVRIEFMKKIIKLLKGTWHHYREETNWRSALFFEYKQFCIDHKLVEPDKGDLPIPEKPKAKAPAKPKKPAKKKES